MTQKTAVEWLYERFLFAGYAVPSEWKEQAKAIEKEQITKAIKDWYSTDVESAEQYYNDTYGS